MARRGTKERSLLGWREWVELQGLSPVPLKAKIDTGARTSTLHAFNLAHHEREGEPWVTFEVHPLQRTRAHSTVVSYPIEGRRRVRSSSGHSYHGKPLSHYDAALLRISAAITFFGLAVVRQGEQMDVYTPNTATGIATSRDKLRSIQILSRHDIRIPAGTFVRDRADVLPAIERVGGAPVVIKLLEGAQGIGVILAPDIKVAEAVIETPQSTKQNVLIQRFGAESKGRGIRAVVVGDRVVAAMRRRCRRQPTRDHRSHRRPFGKRLSRLTARGNGLIIGHTQHALVNQGDAVAHIAEIDPT